MKMKKLVSALAACVLAVSAAVLPAVSSSAASEGPQPNGSWVTRDGTVLSAAQIENSAVKPQLYVSNVEVNGFLAPGAIVEVPVNIICPDNSWCSTGIFIKYDPRLEVVTEVSDYGYLQPYCDMGSAMSDFHGIFVSTLQTRDTGKGIFFASSDGSDSGNSGVIMTFKFILPINAKPGDTYPISVEYKSGDLFTNMARDDAMNAYAFKHAQAGGITVVDYDATPIGIPSFGDLDGSGAIDSTDASITLREYSYIATGQPSTLYFEQQLCADVNSDNAVDSSDASVMLGYYALTATGGNKPFSEFAGR